MNLQQQQQSQHQQQQQEEEEVKKSNKKQYTSKSAPLIAKIRERFFENEWPKNRELYCEEDIERVKNSEWFVKRYLLQSKRNVNDAYNLLVSALRWRNEINFPTLNEQYFPKEFFEIGGLFSYEPDRQGNPVIYLRIRMHKKIKDIEYFVKLFLFYTINRVDLESGENGCTILFDCNGAGYSNMDLELLRSLIDVAFRYFPYSIRLILVYELSWMLNAFRKIAMTFVPSTLASIIKFTTKNDIYNYIERKNLPDFMGGTCKRDYRSVPENCRTIEEACTEFGFSSEKASKILKQFEPYLMESRKAIEAKKKINELTKELSTNDLDNDNLDDNNDNNNEKNTTTTTTMKNKQQIALVHSPKSKSYTDIATIYPQNVLYLKKTQSLLSLMKKNFEPEKENFIFNTIHTIQTKIKKGIIMIRNNDMNRMLAFKIQSNCYCNNRYLAITPNKGILLPEAYISIHIIYNSNNDKKIGNNPKDLININNNKDKLLILLSKNVEKNLLPVYIKNLNKFNQLFIDNTDDQVFLHKLLIKMDDDDDNIKMISCNQNVKRIENRKNIIIINELKLLRKNFRKIRNQQLSINVIILLIIVVMILLSIYNYYNFNYSNICIAQTNSYDDKINDNNIDNQLIKYFNNYTCD